MKYGWLIWISLIGLNVVAQVDEKAFYMESIINQNDPSNHSSERGFECFLPQMGITAYNSSFTFEEIVQSTDGVNKISLEPVLDQLDMNNTTLLRAQLNTIGFSYHTGNITMGLGHSARWLGAIQFSDDLASVMTYGNAALIGSPSDIGTDQDYIYYDEYYLSTSVKVDRWMIGARLKFLSGHEFLETPASSIVVNTSDDGYNIDLNNDYRINTYQVLKYNGLDDVDVNIDPWQYSLPFGKNQGLGFDFGVRGMLTDQLRLNASISDIGAINWDQVTYYTSDENISYEGIDLLDYLSEDGEVDIADSLYNLLDLVEEEGNEFSMSIPRSFSAGLTYDISENHQLGAQYSLMTHNNLSLNSIDLFWQYNLGKGYQSRLNYGVVGKSYHNIGVGVFKRAGLFRWHIEFNNIMGILTPLDVRASSFNIGSSIFIN